MACAVECDVVPDSVCWPVSMRYSRNTLHTVLLTMTFTLSHAVDVTLHYDMARAISFVCLLAAAFSTGVS